MQKSSSTLHAVIPSIQPLLRELLFHLHSILYLLKEMVDIDTNRSELQLGHIEINKTLLEKNNQNLLIMKFYRQIFDIFQWH